MYKLFYNICLLLVYGLYFLSFSMYMHTKRNLRTKICIGVKLKLKKNYQFAIEIENKTTNKYK